MTVDLPSSPLGEVDPQFEKLALDVVAFTFGLPGTSIREKLLQNLTLDVCRSHTGVAFRLGETPTPGAVDNVMRRLGTADEWTTRLQEWQTLRAWSENRLGGRERAIMALTSDVGQQTVDESFHRHVELALDAGLSKDDVRDVVRFCAEYGTARVAAALRELDNVLSSI